MSLNFGIITKKRLFLLLSFMFITIISNSHVYASDYVDSYYADLVVNVKNNGEVQFSGITNHPFLQYSTFDFTSKQGKYWLFNISIDQEFSDAFLEVYLPKEVEINYVKSSGSVSIGSVYHGTVIKIIQSDKPLSVIIQYSFLPSNDSDNNFGWFFYLAIFIILVGFFIVWFKHKKSIKETYWFSDLSFNKRQSIIIDFLKNKSMTQKELESKVDIPKSSLSRNIDSLVRKGVVEKKRSGMTNVLCLKKSK